MDTKSWELLREKAEEQRLKDLEYKKEWKKFNLEEIKKGKLVLDRKKITCLKCNEVVYLNINNNIVYDHIIVLKIHNCSKNNTNISTLKQYI